MNDIPIIGHSRSWKDLQFKSGALVGEVNGEPCVVGYQIGIFATRSDDLPFSVQLTIDPSKFTKDPIASVLQVVNTAIIGLETFRECACVPTHPCLLHAKVHGFN